MINVKPTPTPLPTGYLPVPEEGKINPILRTRFQQIIGSLMYLMIGTRPDIAFAVIKLSQMTANPTQEHINKALYILRYLVGTADYAISYDGSSNQGLVAWTDSDWGNDKSQQRRSQTEYFMKLANGIIMWNSRKQRTVAMSSTEGEYMELSDCLSRHDSAKI